MKAAEGTIIIYQVSKDADYFRWQPSSASTASAPLSNRPTATGFFSARAAPSRTAFCGGLGLVNHASGFQTATTCLAITVELHGSVIVGDYFWLIFAGRIRETTYGSLHSRL